MIKCGAGEVTTVNGNKQKYGKAVPVLEHHTLKANQGLKVQFHAFLTLVLDKSQK
jgi:hypothetical protein